jgi:hypothetical protein
MRTKIQLVCAFVFISLVAFGQMQQYGFKRELSGMNAQWHTISLPNAIFGKVNTDLSDIRIFGVKTNNDTIEAPFIIRQSNEKVVEKEIAFTIINQSKNEKGYYFTFALNNTASINQIELTFQERNFDWRITLEGSQTQNEWFSIVDDYRILSIRNKLTDFHFTSLLFPKANYPFYRLLIKSANKPELISAKIALQETTKGNFRNYTIQPLQIENENKQTLINLALDQAVPISRIQIKCKDSVDYYRPIKIQYPTDSFKTQNGWQYNYAVIASGIINSFENNAFKCNNTTTQKLRIIIDNQDNRPLQIDSVFVTGDEYELIARFDEPGNYFLTYGNRSVGKPQYDIEKFVEKIPTDLIALQLGEETTIDKITTPKQEPLFKNKFWLWGIMLVVILVLAGFTLRMIRKK